MKTKGRKESYLSPRIEVIEVENEGTVMAASANIGDFTGNNSMFGSGNARRGGATRKTSSAVSSPNALQDLEDMINDILTVSK